MEKIFEGDSIKTILDSKVFAAIIEVYYDDSITGQAIDYACLLRRKRAMCPAKVIQVSGIEIH